MQPTIPPTPVDSDPLGEFECERAEGPQPKVSTGAVKNAPPTPETSRRGPRGWRLGTLTLAIAQIPLVAFWLVGVPSPLAQSAQTAAPSATPSGGTGEAPVANEPVNIGGSTPEAPDEPQIGALRIDTQPTRARISVDGLVRGRSPLSLTDLATGSHTVVARFGTRVIERVVELEAGQTLSLVLAGPDDDSIPTGFIAVDTQIPLQVYRDGRLVGSTGAGALTLPAGDHALDIGDEQLGFRVRRTARVLQGATTPIGIELPRVPVSVDVQPWAEVWIDGSPVGLTPVTALQWPIGRHQVRVRHPDLGERSTTLLVTLNQPARLSIDLRSQP